MKTYQERKLARQRVRAIHVDPRAADPKKNNGGRTRFGNIRTTVSDETPVAAHSVKRKVRMPKMPWEET